MMTFSVLIWIGMEENPIDSSTVSQVYVDLFATAILLLGGALACYGFLLCQKMRNVRSERASSEIWKVLSYYSSRFCAIFSGLVILISTANAQEESTRVTFITENSVCRPQNWTASAGSQNQASRGSPI
ncbi:Peptidase S24/S26A/S26B/S26C family protein, putative isoform 1 [Hibiscus syriacus]|uniref:Peptidase S24/S26A/S26B/S26C family protein, putative isoform 1 n=1 Tax=Hibiscus syriacus TaxID=106335 RepID=A0A6A3C731_HIBSY|nr:Peptidase S24/S26A/S26B/S26C family protein, putative isoform 1 [Hibiscus syriacus]